MGMGAGSKLLVSNYFCTRKASKASKLLATTFVLVKQVMGEIDMQ
jgi:hypothetical protein